MKKPSVSELVLRKLHRPAKPNDTTTFLQFIQRYLVPEVREEVQRYFGKIDCLEAQYPGLDYTYPAHRRRLGIFPWHRRLFRAFDELRLTSDEILNLCTWEGTRAAKERYERESQTTIEITTLHGIETADEGQGPRAIVHRRTNAPASRRNCFTQTMSVAEHIQEDYIDDEISDEEEDEESVGVHLNQHLVAAADARERGENVRFDPQWEQWMKEALERNEMTVDNVLEQIRSGRSLSVGTSYPNLQVDGVSQRPISRHGLGTEDSATPTLSHSPVAESEHQSYDQLHDMLDDLQHSNAPMGGHQPAPAAQSDQSNEASSHSVNHARLSTLVHELQANTTRLEAENTAMANYLSSRTETAR